MTIKLLEAPMGGGEKLKGIKGRGHKFLINRESKESFLVSCKQNISHLDSTTLSLTEFHFLVALTPHTFQQSKL